MSFAAMAGWQAALVIGVAVAAAIGLFLLKLRPPQIVVPEDPDPPGDEPLVASPMPRVVTFEDSQ